MAEYRGKRDNPPGDNKPPTVESVLERVLGRAKRKPKMFPIDKFQAARYWMAHQEPANDFTEAVTPLGQNSWNTPYHDRLAARLKAFLRLKHIHQLYVIENIERGIPWRGDDIEFYMAVVKEHDRMDKARTEGKLDDYITDGFELMKKQLRKMQA